MSVFAWVGEHLVRTDVQLAGCKSSFLLSSILVGWLNLKHCFWKVVVPGGLVDFPVPLMWQVLDCEW